MDAATLALVNTLRDVNERLKTERDSLVFALKEAERAIDPRDLSEKDFYLLNRHLRNVAHRIRAAIAKAESK